MSLKNLLIKVTREEATQYYINHSTYNKGDSGIDLFVLEDIEFLPGETKIIDLGIQTAVLETKTKTKKKSQEYKSYYLYPRSSLSKTPLRLANSIGIIDAGYRGNLMGAFTYHPTHDDLKRILAVGTLDCFPPYKVEKGTRLLQLCSNDLTPFDTVSVVDELNETERGQGGFGSTNK
jgi:dUTP pyrophosphatase